MEDNPVLPLDGVVPTTWQGVGNFWTGRGSDGSILVRWSLGRPDGKRGELEVWFSSDADRRPSSVRLSLPDGLTPTALARFPWSRMLAIADSAWVLHSDPSLETRRFFDNPEAKNLERAVEAARHGRRLPRGSSESRPGRRGHPESFYSEIAQEYATLRQGGVTNPTAAIGEAHHVSRSTAAGWVSGARRRKFLPPGRPGRAG